MRPRKGPKAPAFNASVFVMQTYSSTESDQNEHSDRLFASMETFTRYGTLFADLSRCAQDSAFVVPERAG